MLIHFTLVLGSSLVPESTHDRHLNTPVTPPVERARHASVPLGKIPLVGLPERIEIQRHALPGKNLARWLDWLNHTWVTWLALTDHPSPVSDLRTLSLTTVSTRSTVFTSTLRTNLETDIPSSAALLRSSWSRASEIRVWSTLSFFFLSPVISHDVPDCPSRLRPQQRLDVPMRKPLVEGHHPSSRNFDL